MQLLSSPIECGDSRCPTISTGINLLDLINTQIAIALGMIVVTEEPYNADPLGSNDSTDAFIQAISTAGDNQPIYVPYGTYKISGSQGLITGPNTVMLINNALLQGTTANAPILTIGRSGCKLKGILRIDGGSLVGTQGLVLGGLGFTVEQGEYDHIIIDHCAVCVQLNGTPDDSSGGIYMNHFGKLYMLRWTDKGLYLKSGATSRVNANSFDFISAQQGNGAGAFYFDGADSNHFSFVEAENNNCPAYYMVRARGVHVSGGWIENNTFNYQEAPGAAVNVSGVYIRSSFDGDMTSTDPRCDFDHNVGVDRSLIFQLPYSETTYSLRRQAGYLRIGKNGGFGSDQSLILLQASGGMFGSRFSALDPYFLINLIDTGGLSIRNNLGVSMFSVDATRLISPVGLTAGSFTAELNGDIGGRDITFRSGFPSARFLGTMIDYKVTAYTSGILFAFDFDLRNRYEIVSLTADSTFTLSNYPNDNPSQLYREIQVQVVAGNNFKLTTANVDVIWDTQQGFNLGANEILILRAIDGKVRASWASHPRVALPVFANNAGAAAGGLSIGDEYRTAADPALVCVRSV